MRTFLLCVFVCITGLSWAQPQPGDVFREYIWLPDMVKEKGKFLRVGGRLDYQSNTHHFPADQHREGHIPIQEEIDLENAIRAELVLELVQSHEDTKGLRVQLNGKEWLPVPDLAGIPHPQSAYMLHAYPIVPIPLSHLKAGSSNTFKLAVDPEQVWNWPQNIFYGFVFRIYYEVEKSIAQARVQGVKKEMTIGSTTPILSISSKTPDQIKQVDYIGYFDDLNWEGDGQYRQWHHHFHRGVIRNHIGTSTITPFRVNWDLDWLPDQAKPMKVAARVTNKDGLIRITKAVEGLRLNRNYSVELAKPFDQPENWVTRSGEFKAKVAIRGDLQHATEYQLVWKSWSPCYANGIFVNGNKVLDKEGPCYDYYEHQLTLSDLSPLKTGENIITTGKTPLHDGKMVHGMEVQYPGIMLKVKYDQKMPGEVRISTCQYENRDHFLITTPGAVYYYDKAGGGLSRMLDADGQDWIHFKMEPWGDYPAAAASAFRGLPNFVFGHDDAGAGHPGHNQCRSEQVNENTIRTYSNSGKWQWTWQFFASYAKVKIEKVDPTHAYWFLYEGIPGGKWDPANQYFGTNKGGPDFDQLDYYQGNKLYQQWDWAYFGHQQSERVLYIVQQEKDQLSDTFAYLGNTEKGIDSPDGMVVFGFGRTEPAQPLMKKPNTFLVGFYDRKITTAKDHKQLAKMIRKHLKK